MPNRGEIELAARLTAYGLMIEYCLVIVSRLVADREGGTAEVVLEDLEASLLRTVRKTWSREISEAELAPHVTEMERVITTALSAARGRLDV